MCSESSPRSSLTKKIDGIFISDESEESVSPPAKTFAEEDFVEERNIYGMSREIGKVKLRDSSTERKPPIDNSTLQKLVNPNFIFRECCEQRGLPDACLNKCHFNTYTRDA
ncbi:hypothetical protein OSTOST_17339, partial [Ostertagia ostertagi]